MKNMRTVMLQAPFGGIKFILVAFFVVKAFFCSIIIVRSGYDDII
jgi:hypothetical protein